MLWGLILIGIVVVVTFGLGYVNYRLGKAGKSKKVGLVIPVAYVAVRLIMALVQKPNLGTLIVDLLPGLVVAGIYYALYVHGTKKAAGGN